MIGTHLILNVHLNDVNDLIVEYAAKLKSAIDNGTMVETSYNGVFAQFLIDLSNVSEKK